MARRSKPRRAADPTALKASNSGDVRWNKESKQHEWTCDNCGETEKATPHFPSRIRPTQFAVENNTRAIWGKAMDHVRRNCGPAPRPAYRKDLDN